MSLARSENTLATCTKRASGKAGRGMGVVSKGTEHGDLHPLLNARDSSVRKWVECYWGKMRVF